MEAPALFLTSLAKVVSSMNLYREGHPARERAIDHAYGQLTELQEKAPNSAFTFLADEIVFGSMPLRELGNWDWGGRLANAGVQRLEFIDTVSRDDFEAFVEEVHIRMSGEEISTASIRQGRPSNIRYGEVGLRGQDQGSGTGAADVVTATVGYSLREEIESVEWMHGELKDARQLQMMEAEATVRSLSVAMHGDQAYMIPLLRIKDFDQYTVTHTLNVSVLTMALAEHLGLSPKEVRMFGIAGLLHDLGKVKIPNDILNKPGKLTDEERSVMNNHTIEGARIIMETEEHLDLAAVVAYEHHIRIDGGGYPSVTYDRACHQASNLVHVCDVFDALRTDRPYRDAWPTERALSIIEEGAGPEFDKDVATAFVQMMRKWETQVAEVSTENPEVSLADTKGGLNGAGEDGAPEGEGKREGGAVVGTVGAEATADAVAIDDDVISLDDDESAADLAAAIDEVVSLDDEAEGVDEVAAAIADVMSLAEEEKPAGEVAPAVEETVSLDDDDDDDMSWDIPDDGDSDAKDEDEDVSWD